VTTGGFFFALRFALVVALRALVSRLALCPANLPVLQAMGHVAEFQVRKGEGESNGEFGYNIRCLEVREGLSNQL